MAGHILLAEDDKALSALMQDFFRAAGVAVTPAYDGEQALVLAQEQPFDLLVLDVMMPHLNGLEVCEAVRQESDVPVIFVTALGQEGDTLAGFRAGADDYITKPFGTSEMLARIRAAIRHSRAGYQGPAGGMTGVFEAKGLLIDYDKHRAYKGGLDLNLTQNEFRLVSLLSRYAGKVLTYDFMIREIWGPNMENNNRILRVNMANIRRKLEKNPAQPEYIFTEIGVGYRMIEPEG